MQDVRASGPHESDGAEVTVFNSPTDGPTVFSVTQAAETKEAPRAVVIITVLLPKPSLLIMWAMNHPELRTRAL